MPRMNYKDNQNTYNRLVAIELESVTFKWRTPYTTDIHNDTHRDEYRVCPGLKDYQNLLSLSYEKGTDDLVSNSSFGL